LFIVKDFQNSIVEFPGFPATVDHQNNSRTSLGHHNYFLSEPEKLD